MHARGRDGVVSAIVGDDVQRPEARQKRREILEEILEKFPIILI